MRFNDLSSHPHQHDGQRVSDGVLLLPGKPALSLILRTVYSGAADCASRPSNYSSLNELSKGSDLRSSCEGMDQAAEAVEQLEARVRTVEVCRRLVYMCAVAASITAQTVAQSLLLQWYRRAGRRRLDQEDHVIVPLLQRFLNVPSLGRLAMTCRTLKKRSWFSGDRCAPKILTSWFHEFSDDSKREVLSQAIQHNVPTLVKPVIEAGGNPNCVFHQFWFRTPLHRAASHGHVEICRSLLDLKADTMMKDSHGASPMHLVASKGRLPIVDLLLTYDLSCSNAVDYCRRTPCHMAALKGHLTVLRWLVIMRADFNSGTLDGRTPLFMARRAQHTECIEYLDDLRAHQEEDLPAARRLLEGLFARTSLAIDNYSESPSPTSASSQPP